MGVPSAVGVYPIGVDVEAVNAAAAACEKQDKVQRMIASLLGRKLIIGVDRLDYSKGLTERFASFEHFLETFPDKPRPTSPFCRSRRYHAATCTLIARFAIRSRRPPAA